MEMHCINLITIIIRVHNSVNITCKICYSITDRKCLFSQVILCQRNQTAVNLNFLLRRESLSYLSEILQLYYNNNNNNFILNILRKIYIRCVFQLSQVRERECNLNMYKTFADCPDFSDAFSYLLALRPYFNLPLKLKQ